MRQARRPAVGGCALPDRRPRPRGAGATAAAVRSEDRRGRRARRRVADHLEETREHQRLLEARLAAHDRRPSPVQDTALRVGGGSLGAFFAAQPDAPVKLAGFAFAFEHLEIAGYELLRRVAERAGDAETAATAREIVVDERRAAARVGGTWDAAMDAALERLVGEGVR